MPGRSGDTGHSEALGQVGPACRAGRRRAARPAGARSTGCAHPSRCGCGVGPHRCLMWVASFAAALILVVRGSACGALVQGPVELGRLTPTSRKRSTGRQTGTTSPYPECGSPLTAAAVNSSCTSPGVRLSRTDGKPIASFSEISTGFSLGSLLRGRLTPTRLVVERPVLRFVRDQDGKIGFRFGGQDADAPGFGPEILAAAAGPRSRRRRSGRCGRSWFATPRCTSTTSGPAAIGEADSVDATLERNPDGLAGDLSLATMIGARTPEIHASYRYRSS